VELRPERMLACARDRVDNDYLLRSNIPARRRFRLYLGHLEWSRAHAIAMNENMRSILVGTAVLGWELQPHGLRASS
jgi:hypothetical protein